MYKSLWIIHRKEERETQTHSQTECVCILCLCVINCQEELLAAQGSRPNSAVLAVWFFSPLLHPWLPSANMLVLKFSYHWYGWKFTPFTVYALQGSLKTWVIFHPGCKKKITTDFSFHKRTYSFASMGGGGGGGGGGVADNVMIFPFVSEIFVELRIFEWIFTCAAKVLMSHCV